LSASLTLVMPEKAGIHCTMRNQQTYILCAYEIVPVLAAAVGGR
ncbi:MAG: hypothetical protein K0R53_2546, partial [Burkholderiales bacterium]|nr:hypothetical protein [Burkholderiales bacterium]